MDRALFLLTSLRLAGQLHAQPPVHHWPLNESGGAVALDVTGASDGLLQNAATWQPSGGQVAGALQLNGNDASVVAGPCDLTTGTGDAISLACWFKPEIVSGSERILMAKAIGPNDPDFVWSLSLVNSTGARFRLRTADVVHTVEVPSLSIFSNAWYHLAATYDGSTMRVYLNGSLTFSGPAMGTIGYHPQAPTSFGNLISDMRPFFGSLDDVRMYDRALTDQEVVDLVIGDISTVVPEPARPIAVQADGSLLMPNGPWEHIRIMDLQGRVLLDQALAPSSIPPVLPDRAAGIHLVCLQEGSRLLTQRLYLP